MIREKVLRNLAWFTGLTGPVRRLAPDLQPFTGSNGALHSRFGEKVMTSSYNRVCAILLEALHILDGSGEQLAAIHVNQALEALGCPVCSGEHPITIVPE